MPDFVKQREKTIADFGEQWTTYRSNDGFYASQEMFADMLGPYEKSIDIKNAKAIDIGSGTGRIVMMLLEAGAAHVTAVEPSAAFDVLRTNLQESGITPERYTLLNCRGDEVPEECQADLAFSIGVLHHIPDPHPVVRAVYNALRPGGKFVIWLYGKEGNGLYLTFIEPLRKITKHMPHWALVGLVWMLYIPLCVYTLLCHVLPLPLKNYLLNVLFRMSPEKRRLVIYDQLNPEYAKYYTRRGAEDLLQSNGFKKVAVHNRRGYSWTVIGTKA